MPLRLAAAAALALSLTAGAAPAQDIAREGGGERRTKLDAMERTPFDQTLWSKLESWTNGGPLTPAETDGKVVLIYTWASWYPVAMSPMATVNRLQERHGEDGLIVVGVHDAQGWEDAAQQAERRRATFRIAHDAKGAFREALMVDQDPDFYLIDRAGQLRYADVDTGALEQAVDTLLGESAKEAGSVNERLEAERLERETDARRLRQIRSQVTLSNMPEVPFPEPDPSAYEAVIWPAPREEERSRGRDQEWTPVQLDLPAEGWLPAPPTTAGRARVVYFWHPETRTSYDRVIPMMDALQRAHERDLVVAGVMSPLDDRRNRRRDDEGKSDEELMALFPTFFQSRRIDHFLVPDLSGGLRGTVEGTRGRSGGRDEFTAYGAVISSDGKVRWEGPVFSDAFRAAVERVLRVDPGVQARRAADQAFLRARPGG